MTWAEHHKTSNVLAESARDLAERGEEAAARARFAEAAESEERALACVNPETEPRTYGVTSVSAAALWYKASEFARATQIAERALQVPTLARFARVQLDELLEKMNPAKPRASARRWALGVGIAAAVAIAAVGLGWWLASRGEVYSTRIGEVRSVTLEEGTVVHLNTRTDLRLVDPGNARDVRLVSGEALFEVRHDPARPFVVELDHSQLRVLGTRFNVYRRPNGDIEVTVIEGIVEISGGASGNAWTRRISAGQQTVYRPEGPPPEPHGANTASVVSWRSHEFRVPPEGMPLKQIADELMRYTDKRIEFPDPRVAKLVVAGNRSLPTNDIPAALDRLKSFKIITWSERDGKYVVEAAIDSQR